MRFGKIIHSSIPGDVTGWIEIKLFGVTKKVVCHRDGTITGECFLDDPRCVDLPSEIFEILLIGEQAAGRLARRARS